MASSTRALFDDCSGWHLGIKFFLQGKIKVIVLKDGFRFHKGLALEVRHGNIPAGISDKAINKGRQQKDGANEKAQHLLGFILLGRLLFTRGSSVVWIFIPQRRFMQKAVPHFLAANNDGFVTHPFMVRGKRFFRSRFRLTQTRLHAAKVT